MSNEAKQNEIDSIFERLAAPFEPEHIEWRSLESGIGFSGNPWIKAAAYIDNRAVQTRLDTVLGPMNWRNEYQRDQSGCMCGLSIRVNNEWITKWDGSEYTNYEPLKGAVSGSMKRAAVQFGIGRYLYALEAEFVHIVTKDKADESVRENGKYERIYQNKRDKKTSKFVDCYWFPPVLPAWALPRADFTPYLDAIKAAASLDELKTVYETAYRAAEALNNREMLDQVISLKDEIKPRLSKQAEDNTIAKNKEFLQWLNHRIRDLITSAENESILELNKKRLLQEVKGHCRANKINATDFVEQVNAAYQTAQSTLRN